MERGITLAALLAALATCGCGDVGNPHYYKPEIDTDVGLGPDDDSDDDAEPPSGDPCDVEQNPWSCDPLTAEGCQSAESACDYGVHQGVPGFYCYVGGTEPEGNPCITSRLDGPWCLPGLTCRGGVCVEFCCSAADCAGQTCLPVEWELVEGALGTCPAPVDTDSDTGTDTGTDTDTDTVTD